ncbi:unnamed protein product [Lymnaea stagnalis]|uniref:Uncharacterized protein n=1 Tax=Lymnaea stagnalis TaxID=6523 RepID=A0AAV2HDT0_LYMST
MYKLSALTISKCLITAIHLLLFRFIKEIHGQEVQLDPNGMEVVSPCSSDLRAGLDFYIVRGIVNDTTGKLSNLIDFETNKTSTNKYQTICTISLTTCITPNPQHCYCAAQKGNIYEIVVNRSAFLSESNAVIRIKWESTSGVSVVSNELQVPKIYDLDSVTTSLTLNDAPATCPLAITRGSVIKFQCQNSPSPCYLTIAVNEDVVKGEHSATYTVTYDPMSYSTHNFTFSYSISGGPTQTTNCRVDIAKSSDPSLKFATWCIVLVVIFYIGIVVTVIIVIAILYFIKASKMLSNLFKIFVVFLVFAEILCIILIIVFALAKPSTNDPEPGSNILAQWKIMLIIYCVFQGALLIAAVVFAIIYRIRAA